MKVEVERIEKKVVVACFKYINLFLRIIQVATCHMSGSYRLLLATCPHHTGCYLSHLLY
jgi:hypothetical protein